MIKKSTKKLVLSGLFIALGLVLPFLTGQIPNFGRMLLPMHLPALICGFVCGWKYGLVVGLIMPVFRSVLFGMPPMIPTAVSMSFELAAFGLFAGLIYAALAKKPLNVYVSLISAMIIGRVVYGIASFFIYMAQGNAFTFSLFISGAFVNSLPGIIIQIVIIPPLILVLEKNKLIPATA